MEELQKKAPQAKVVKAFNTVFAQHMDKGQVKGERLSLLIAGMTRPPRGVSSTSEGLHLPQHD